jgi:hypothetical protein
LHSSRCLGIHPGMIMGALAGFEARTIDFHSIGINLNRGGLPSCAYKNFNLM